MSVLEEHGGIYLDTDAFSLRSFSELLQHDFALGFDNIVNPDTKAPKRLNNGVLISKPHAAFLTLWSKAYAQFNPSSFDHDSSVVPFKLATEYPDTVHIEWFRLSPVSYGFQTALAADALTCGLYTVDGIWHPAYLKEQKVFSFTGTQPDRHLLQQMEKKFVLHLTMSQVRGLSMLRKHLNSPADLEKMPSFLGHVFRLAYYGKDDFDYTALKDGSDALRLDKYKTCREFLGMYTPPEEVSKLPHERQQYQPL